MAYFILCVYRIKRELELILGVDSPRFLSLHHRICQHGVLDYISLNFTCFRKAHLSRVSNRFNEDVVHAYCARVAHSLFLRFFVHLKENPLPVRAICAMRTSTVEAVVAEALELLALLVAVRARNRLLIAH